ncbi:proteasome accessory factor B [Tessaracoccus bendigoensis DSM 12906]|uniref:Proteasome accessory factor B n=1 Tax=Tessaracoccus bendigoensis DSM 12906 TaxID=1123357 RepID=A0A1M6LK27_9ACTN|nr:WYL domain-containing protein [Tessaracoccus bendigoensis]SHJ71564.1 proteasome accessory factor B [Tessaracoccus bendigoensis DSM 12906]
MTQRKSERLVNLLIALLSTRRFLTRHELRRIVEGYRDSADAAFERQFERDKEELRALGIEVETGSNDRFFEDEEGYRINRADFELPEIAFTSAELSALALAGQVWQDSVAADHTAQAFEALKAGGAAPDPSLVPTVRPQVSVSEPDFDVLYDAVVRRVEVEFGYGGETRRLQPWQLLQRRGRWYVFGLDLERQADRFFKLTRFTAPAKQRGKAGAYQVPADANMLAQRLEPVNDAVAVVALRTGIAHNFGETEPVEWDGVVPDGLAVYRVGLATAAAIVTEVAAAGPDAILLAPEDLRAQVVEHLRGVAS